MKDLLNPEGTLFQFLSRIGDLIILNFLFMICCVPVITAGASMAALYKVTIDMVFDQEAGVFKGFFKAFRDNFKQATIVWLVMLLVLVSLACDLLLVFFYFGVNKTMYILLGVLAFVVMCVSAYMIPLLVRYTNTLRQHLANAAALAVVKLPITVAMVVLNALPVLILAADFALGTQVFLQTLVFWLFIGFAFVVYLNVSMLKKVFHQLEAGNDNVTLGV